MRTKGNTLLEGSGLDFVVDAISAAIDNREFEKAAQIANRLQDSLRTEQMRRIEEAKASRHIA